MASSETNRPVVCVFCGASPGNSDVYIDAARSLAKTFAQHNIQLVYGGGTTGIMGEVAKSLVALKGPSYVHGIIPRSLLRTERNFDVVSAVKAAHGNGNGTNGSNGTHHGSGVAALDFDIETLIAEREYGRTTVVEDMHTRKQMMKSLVVAGGPGSGFVALTGGYGTIEELMEMVTWNQLGIHAMPVVLFNVQGYWDGILEWVRKAVETGFISGSNARIMAEATTSEDVVARLMDYVNSEGRFKLDWNER